MKKKNSDSLAIGMCIGAGIGIIFNHLTLGLAIGVCIGVTGALSSKKKK